jgi:hypothetical protein
VSGVGINPPAVKDHQQEWFFHGSSSMRGIKSESFTTEEKEKQ